MYKASWLNRRNQRIIDAAREELNLQEDKDLVATALANMDKLFEHYPPPETKLINLLAGCNGDFTSNDKIVMHLSKALLRQHLFRDFCRGVHFVAKAYHKYMTDSVLTLDPGPHHVMRLLSNKHDSTVKPSSNRHGELFCYQGEPVVYVFHPTWMDMNTMQALDHFCNKHEFEYRWDGGSWWMGKDGARRGYLLVILVNPNTHKALTRDLTSKAMERARLVARMKLPESDYPFLC